VVKSIENYSLGVKRENRSVMKRMLTCFKKDTNQLDKLVIQLSNM